MKSSIKAAPIAVLLALCLALSVPTASANDGDSAIAACLKAWGEHPFGKHPQFKTLGTSLTVFGIGNSAADTRPTSSPALVLVKPSFNFMGGSTMELLNPNGWYCVQTLVSIIGRTTIRAQCKAQLAATSDGKTMLASKAGNRRIKNIAFTVIGSTAVERPCN